MKMVTQKRRSRKTREFSCPRIRRQLIQISPNNFSLVTCHDFPGVGAPYAFELHYLHFCKRTSLARSQNQGHSQDFFKGTHITSPAPKVKVFLESGGNAPPPPPPPGSFEIKGLERAHGNKPDLGEAVNSACCFKIS